MPEKRGFSEIKRLYSVFHQRGMSPSLNLRIISQVRDTELSSISRSFGEFIFSVCIQMDGRISVDVREESRNQR